MIALDSLVNGSALSSECEAGCHLNGEVAASIQ